MDYPDLLRRRLCTQHVSCAPLASPADVVRGLVAVQSQDYVAARWALAQRVADATLGGLDAAFDRGDFLRTHVMRPTWHFVAPEDLRWLLELTAPRVNTANGFFYRTWRLDARAFARSQRVIADLLQGGRHLTRRAVVDGLVRKRIVGRGDSGYRAIGLLMRAELDGLICSGPRRDGQFTYALLEERVPAARPFDREQALAGLARRFFLSHGPATLKDLAWWSGLTMKDSRIGLESVRSGLDSQSIDGEVFWFAPSAPRPRRGSRTVHMLAAYDETLIAYRDGRRVFKPYAPQLTRDSGQLMVADGRALGSWRRGITRGGLTIEMRPFAGLTPAETRAAERAVERYGAFHHLGAVLAVRPQARDAARGVSSRASSRP